MKHALATTETAGTRADEARPAGVAFAASVISLCLCAATFLPGQGPTGAGLRGQALDPSGAAIPNAVVTVTGPNGVNRTGATDATGSFLF